MGDRPVAFPSFKSAPQTRIVSTRKKLEATVLPKNGEEGEKATRLLRKEESNRTFTLDHGGDFDIFQFDCKLSSQTVPRHQIGSMHVVGFSDRMRIVITESGEFDIASQSKCSDSTRFYRRTNLGAGLKCVPSNVEPDFYQESFIAFAEPTEVAVSNELAKLYLAVKQSPLNVEKWIELVRAQPKHQPSCSRRAIVERQISILQTALLKMPDSIPLLNCFFQLERELYSPFELLELWNIVLEKHGSNGEMRWAHIMFFYRHCCSIFTVQKAFELWMSLVTDIVTGVVSVTYNVRLATIKQLLFLLFGSGNVASALQILYAITLGNEQVTKFPCTVDDIESSGGMIDQWYFAEKRDILSQDSEDPEDLIDSATIQLIKRFCMRWISWEFIQVGEPLKK
jgi:hypothetical protein